MGYRALVADIKLYLLLIVNQVLNITILIDGINTIAKTIAAILTIGIAYFTIRKVKQDLLNKKEQAEILKLQKEQEQQKLYELIQRNKKNE